MANFSSEDETDTLPKRPTRIQPYQFEPVRLDFESESGYSDYLTGFPEPRSTPYTRRTSLKNA